MLHICTFRSSLLRGCEMVTSLTSGGQAFCVPILLFLPVACRVPVEFFCPRALSLHCLELLGRVVVFFLALSVRSPK